MVEKGNIEAAPGAEVATPPARPRPAFEILEVTGEQTELVQACYDIRIEVFVVEQGFPLEVEIDEYDKRAVFFLLNVLEDGGSDDQQKRRPVGTARIVPGMNKVGRLAILKPYRKYGFGRELMLAVHKWVEAQARAGKAEGVAVPARAQLSAQIYAIPFYAKLGYEPTGEEYDEDGAPHQKMVKTFAPPS